MNKLKVLDLWTSFIICLCIGWTIFNIVVLNITNTYDIWTFAYGGLIILGLHVIVTIILVTRNELKIEDQSTLDEEEQ